MEISVEELNELLEKAHDDALKRHNTFYTTTEYYKYSPYIDIPKACRNCLNHPSNGGSGICNCILGNTPITC